MSEALLASYYEAHNRGDAAAMLALLTDDILHEPSQGAARSGKSAYADFLADWGRCYREKIVDPVFLMAKGGAHGAAEYQIEGVYLESEAGLPPATRQPYRLRAGAFFAFRDGQIARVTNHTNLVDWIAQVS